MEQDIGKLKVVDLKKELQKRSLSTAGLKAELVERLQEALDAEGQGKGGEDAREEKEGEEVGLNGSDADNDDDAAQGDVDGTCTTSKAEQVEVIKVEESAPLSKDDDHGESLAAQETEIAITEPIPSEEQAAAAGEPTSAQPESLSARLGAAQPQEAESVAETEIDIGNDIDETQEPALASPSKGTDETLQLNRLSQGSDEESSAELAHNTAAFSVHHDPPTPLSIEDSKKTVALGKAELNDLLPMMHPSPAIYVSGLIRPLTLSMLRMKAEEYGELLDASETSKAIWLDGIKTHAYITFKTVQAATTAREALSGTVFPAETGREVQAYFVPVDLIPRCIQFEDKAWEEKRGRVELRVRQDTDSEKSSLLYSLHLLDAETAKDTSRGPVDRAPITLTVAGAAGIAQRESSEHKKNRGIRGGRGRQRAPAHGAPSYDYPRHTPSNGFHGGARREDFERQSADRRRDYRGADHAYDARSYPHSSSSSSRSRGHGDSADERLRQLEARLLAQRRERGVGAGDGGGSGAYSRARNGSDAYGGYRESRRDGPDLYSQPRHEGQWR